MADLICASSLSQLPELIAEHDGDARAILGRVGIDPAVVSAPFISTLVDATGLDWTSLSEHVYVYYDTKAVEHLLTLACGLDSMAVGEAQIRQRLAAADPMTLLADRPEGPVVVVHGRQDEPVQWSAGDDRIPVGCDVVAARVAAGDARLGEGRESGADLVDGEVDEVRVRAVPVVVGIRYVERREIAVAEQNLAPDVRSDVLQRHQIGEDRHLAEVLTGVNHHDLFPMHRDRHVDTVRREEIDIERQ